MPKAANICSNFQESTYKSEFQIFQKKNCKSDSITYLMEYTLCNNQYFGKLKRAFNIRLNNHKKYGKYLNATLVCKYFEEVRQKLNTKTKITIVEKLNEC